MVDTQRFVDIKLEELFDYPNLPLSVETLKPLLIEAKTAIDELREQNKIMRKILEMINWDHDINDKDINRNRSCAWCGSLYNEKIQHEDSCIIATIQTLLPTIPEIK